MEAFIFSRVGDHHHRVFGLDCVRAKGLLDGRLGDVETIAPPKPLAPLVEQGRENDGYLKHILGEGAETVNVYVRGGIHNSTRVVQSRDASLCVHLLLVMLVVQLLLLEAERVLLKVQLLRVLLLLLLVLVLLVLLMQMMLLFLVVKLGMELLVLMDKLLLLLLFPTPSLFVLLLLPASLNAERPLLLRRHLDLELAGGEVLGERWEAERSGARGEAILL